MTNHDSIISFDCVRTYRNNKVVRSALEQSRLEELSAGDVVLQTLYAGINYKDSLAISGAAPIIASYPRIAGIEAVGVVQASSNAAFQAGDLVLVHGHGTGVTHDGGFSAVMRVPSEHLQLVPQGLNAFECAMLGVPAFSVAMALEKFEQAGLEKDSSLIAVSGATGAVGMLAIAILSVAGYRVAAITRRMENTPMLKALGAIDVIDAAVL